MGKDESAAGLGLNTVPISGAVPVKLGRAGGRVNLAAGRTEIFLRGAVLFQRGSRVDFQRRVVLQVGGSHGAVVS